MTVTLITGASSGIGRYLANYYWEMGHIVLGVCRSGTFGNTERYTEYCTDVSNESQVRAMFKSIPEVDNLINCAGIASMNHALLTPMDKVFQVLQTNVGGTFLMCREAARLMARQKHGRIVNFSSVAAPLNLAGESIYAASKAAVESLTRTLAKEFASFRTTVNAIGPNPIATDLIKGVSQEKINDLVACQAITRMGTMEDVANVVDFFLRPESEFITGQTIYLGGVS